MKKQFFSWMLAASMVASTLVAPAASAAEQVNVIRLKPAAASPFNNGEFEGWGTSMGWWGNRLGYSDTLAQQAAELFYSENGLGLDIVRYNVGGGDHPDHNHITRSDSKLPGFAVPQYNEDGSFVKDENGDIVYDYDWTADYNQMNVLKEIKKANPDVHIEGYTNSPPWFMTNSQCSGGGVDSGENLDPSNYDVFAKFLGDVTEHFEEIGLKFDSYSPMNEPSTQKKYWGAMSVKQEGNHVSQGANQSGIINALSAEYDSRGIDTLVVGLDETSIDYSVNAFNSLDDTAKANLDRLDTHSYEGSKRAQLKQTAIDGGKNLWMSEVDGNWNAFGLANRIMTDLNGMQASAWVLWDIVDFHKDSAFTDPSGNHTEANASINPDGSMWGMAMGNHDTQNIELSMKYYGFGQFTRYIKPGMTLIDSSSSSLAAYDKETGDIVIVAVNTGADALTQFDLREFESTGSKAKVIRTSGSFNGGEKWAELDDIDVEGKQFTATLKSNSITTFVVEGERGEEDGVKLLEFTANSEGLSYKYDASSVAEGCDVYFAVYKDGELKLVTMNESEKSIAGDFEGCTPKLMVWDGLTPLIKPITEIYQAPGELRYMTIDGSTSAVTGVGYNYSAAVGPTAVDTPITWSVSDETIATVTENGVLTALTSGRVTLTATAAELGLSTAIDIEIIDAEQILTIVNKNSGLGIETKSQQINSGALIEQWQYRGLDTSAWKVSPTEDGYFNIINQNAGMLLVANADAKPAISNTVDAADAAAKWELISHGSAYEIKNVSVGKSLNVSGQSIANGGSVILYEFGGGNNELWTLNPVEGNLVHVEAAPPTDYSEKYADTDYKFVSNVEAWTNDFTAELKGFVVSGNASLGADTDGEPVLKVMDAPGSGKGAGTATLEPETPLACTAGQIINLAADMYFAHSNGTSTFALTASDGTELVKIEGANWGADYTVVIGGVSVETAGDCNTYFKNGKGDKTNDAFISNGGHVEIYYTPSTGEITVTIKNVTNTAEAKEYTGTVAAGKDIAKLEFASSYSSYARPMLADNLVTNIILGSNIAGEVQISGSAQIGETLTATVSGFEAADVKYQWQANTGEEGAYVNIDGATESTYVIADTLVGKTVRCVVTADGFDGELVSESTVTIIDASSGIPTLAGTVTIEENGRVGNTLTAVAAINEGAVAKYQWQINNGEEGAYVNIDGATANTLVLTEDFIGYSVKCVVTADNFDGNVESETAVDVYSMAVSGNDVVVTGADYTYSAVLNSVETDEAEWTVSGEGAATVENGVLTATGAGKITVTASVDGKTASYEVLAVDAQQNISLANQKSGLGLETQGKGVASGTMLVQWEDRGLDISAWKLAAADNGYFNIVNQNAGMLLSVDANGKPVITDAVDGTDDNAKWQLIAHDGSYEVKNVATGKSLNVNGQSVDNGGSVILYAFGGGENELWTINAIEGELEHVEAVVVDYSAKYADTDYKYVSNISAATNDFETGLYGFVLSGVASMATDAAGKNVLGVQPKYDNKNGGVQIGAAVLALDDALVYSNGQIINMAFDLYCSNSGGTAGFSLLGSDDAELVKMVVSGWNNFDMTIGETNVSETGGAATYLRNNVNDVTGDQLISNGGHFEIYFKPATGDVTITLKNNTNTSETKIYTGNVGAGASVSKLSFNVDHTTWSKQVFVDNLVTNIITDSYIAGEVQISGDAQVGATLTAAVSGFEAAPVNYQWQSNSGEEGVYVDIDGATESTYVITEDLVGKTVRCVVTADGFDGELISESTVAIIDASSGIPTLEGTVTIAGDVYVGKTLTATAAVNDTAVAKYQWQVKPGTESAYVNIDGATTDTLDLTDDFIGKSVKCVVTADNFEGSVESDPTDEITKRTIAGEVTVSGDVKLGSTLTAEVSGLDEDAAAKYQWQANNGEEGAYVDIDGATSNTITVTEALLGYSVKCVVTADNFDGSIASEETAELYSMAVSGNDVVVTNEGYTYSAILNSAETDEAEWSVSGEGVATIENGVLTATGAGKITVTATVDGKSASYDVLVVDAEQNLSFINKNSGLGLETQGQGVASGSMLVQWTHNGLDTSAWKLVAADDGCFNIVNQNAGMLLSVNAGGKPVIDDSVDGADDNAKWQLIAHDGSYEIKNVATTKSLDVSGASLVDGGNVILYAFGGGANALWSINVIEGELEHVEAVAIDYSAKYADSGYNWVSNVETLTNDFMTGLNGFEVSGNASLNTDSNGEPVLKVMDAPGSGAAAGNATLTLEESLTCEDGQIINFAADMYFAHSNGTSTFVLSSSDDTELVKIEGSSWGGVYTVVIGGVDVETAGDCNTYFKNGKGDKTNNAYITDAGHVEVYYNPSTGEITVTIKNVTNSAEAKTYAGIVDEGKDLSKVYFASEYSSYSRPMIVDNLVTNIIEAVEE